MTKRGDRWPAEIVTHLHKRGDTELELHCKVDFDPQTGAAKGFKIWRTDKTGTGHDIDEALDEISRKGSRVIQGLYP